MEFTMDTVVLKPFTVREMASIFEERLVLLTRNDGVPIQRADDDVVLGPK